MDGIDVHREGLRWAFELLEMVMADVTPELVTWHPPGIANPLGAIYAHAIADLDAIINVILKGGEPLFAGEWQGKTGISEPRWVAELEWARTVQVDLPAARQYAQAMYENADTYLASLSPEDLDREIDLSANGLGVQTVSWCLTALVTSHLNNMAGEISTLKGLQGARGYPF
ncbi:MAG TPA: DinB family protein [Anaerolineales bacterium]|nr:DinB family protein [Anaerolineales bacterium]